jgi:hypothetical protein
LTVFAPPPRARPTPLRWPRLEELTLESPGLGAPEALGAETWDRLHTLSLGDQVGSGQSALDEPGPRAAAGSARGGGGGEASPSLPSSPARSKSSSAPALAWAAELRERAAAAQALAARVEELVQAAWARRRRAGAARATEKGVEI